MALARRGDTFEAEEDRPTLHQIGLTVVWAMVAILALTVAFMAGRSEPGARRLYAALDSLPWPLQSAASLAADAATTTRIAREDAEARALTETVKALATDRDRLMARLELLERDRDVTASIPKRSASPAAPADATALLFNGPSVTLALTADQHASALPAIAPRLAATESVATKTEFGIDLGTAPTVEGLRALWNTLKAQHSGSLEGLRPVIALQESDKPGIVTIRLVAGPLANAAAAARLCAILAGTLTACQPTTFEGQRLASR
jgi:hypothetical protein